MTVLMGAWIALLHRHGEERDVSLHYRSDGRSGRLTQAIGAYAIDLPLTVRIELHQEFTRFLQRLQGVLEEDQEWLDYAPVIDTAASSASIHPFGFDYVSVGRLSIEDRVLMTIATTCPPPSQFRLNLQCIAGGEKLDVVFHYDASRFSAAAIERLSEQWVTLLKSVSHQPATTISRLRVMSLAERERFVQCLRGG